MIKEIIKLTTNYKVQMHSITNDLRTFVRKHKITDGKIHVFVPHTTAAVTINENCDPNVQTDLNNAMKKIFPETLNNYHAEGNSPAHLMSSIIGVGLDIYIEKGELLLGTWQGVYFWEFDGPRERTYYLLAD
jgi:secondary thiamine-phosphate synthase enzyme